MAEVLFCGMAVVDFVFQVDEMPRAAEKYRADDAGIVGGGCAATAAVACARLGGRALMAGRLGDDQIGALIADGLTAEGVDCAWLRRFPGARSSWSSIYVDAAGERQIVNFRGADLPDDADWLDIGAAGAVLADTRWVAGGLAVLRAARAKGVPGVLDGEAPIDPALAGEASHVAFSLQGLRDFTGETDRDKALRLAAARLPGWVCVTDGAAGAFIAGDEITHVPAPRVEVVDTLGAGDVWHGAFALRLAEGVAEAEAVRFANAAAALKCTQRGGRDGAPTRAATEELLERMTEWN